MLSPEVQLRIIDLAWEWVLKSRAGGAIPLTESIKDMGRRFDEAYKSIYATVKEQ
ncbi:MAG: hypothetical protein PHO26_00960 [Dehalococcoidia bacterium]|nr:hypothetical protein [Dehalococcoidia bacterium]MDD5493659.1 hypothetical protein [Dehalococcoidia bacterium]